MPAQKKAPTKTEIQGKYGNLDQLKGFKAQKAVIADFCYKFAADIETDKNEELYTLEQRNELFETLTNQNIDLYNRTLDAVSLLYTMFLDSFEAEHALDTTCKMFKSLTDLSLEIISHGTNSAAVKAMESLTEAKSDFATQIAKCIEKLNVTQQALTIIAKETKVPELARLLKRQITCETFYPRYIEGQTALIKECAGKAGLASDVPDRLTARLAFELGIDTQAMGTITQSAKDLRIFSENWSWFEYRLKQAVAVSVQYTTVTARIKNQTED